MTLRSFLLGSVLYASAAAQTAVPNEPATLPARAAPAAAPASEAAPETAAQPPAQAAAETEAQRTSLNLLGQTAADKGESRRNENVQFNLVDNNALKELNVRLGTTATIVGEFQVELGSFGTEFGAPPVRPIHAPGIPGARQFHGGLFHTHQNSLFTARAFFQVGEVQPARENAYGARATAPAWKGALLSLNGSQIKIRGQVNGNALIPLGDERTPLTNDPLLRPIVEQYLSGYPNVLPNRTDIAERALNTNSPQSIDTDTGAAQLDQRLSGKDRLTFRYSFTGQDVEAFQFVFGQNPDTTTKNHGARITWSRAWSPAVTTETTVGFDRLTSLLVPTSGDLPSINVGFEITSLAPPPPIPIDRVLNRYRYGSNTRRTGSKHTLTAGFQMTRLQYNGEETDGHRGILSFNRTREVENGIPRDYTAIDNLRRGRPVQLIQALGATYRGFRNWSGAFYAGDVWRVRTGLTLNYGLRWEPFTRPIDVTGRSDLAFGSDLNNWAPSFGFAYRPKGSWGVLRGAYSINYGEIFPVTYGQDRLNAPHSLRVVINNPNLADPLGGIRFEDLDPTTRTSLIEVGPDLATPYAHHYNFSWQFEPAPDWRVEAGYVGSRSHKLIQTYFLNRGLYVPGMPFTIANMNDRRANPNLFEHLFIHNGSHGYFDAARVSLIVPRWRAFAFNASYWFSKALDTGSNYTNTASGPDARDATGQVEWDSMKDLKGLSNFDQPHSFLFQGGFDTPRGGRTGWMDKLFGGWNLAGVFLLKSGTPFTVLTGSDAPGFGNADGRASDRPDLLDLSLLGKTVGNPDTSEALLRRNAFAYPQAPARQAGTLGRNTFRKGRIANVNASLARTFPMPGETRLTFRAESINFFNTPQFAAPTFQLTSPSFGQINNTLNDGRTFRFTLRFDW